MRLVVLEKWKVQYKQSPVRTVLFTFAAIVLPIPVTLAVAAYLAKKEEEV